MAHPARHAPYRLRGCRRRARACVPSGSVDKRGRRIGKNAGLAELTKLYRPDAPEAVDVEGKAAATAKRDIELNAKLARLNAVARGEVDVGSSSSDDSSDSDSEEVDLAVEDEVLALPEAARGEAPRTTLAGHETRRLAAVDMDWEHISSVDILAALQVRGPRAMLVDDAGCARVGCRAQARVGGALTPSAWLLHCAELLPDRRQDRARDSVPVRVRAATPGACTAAVW